MFVCASVASQDAHFAVKYTTTSLLLLLVQHKHQERLRASADQSATEVIHLSRLVSAASCCQCFCSTEKIANS